MSIEKNISAINLNVKCKIILLTNTLPYKKYLTYYVNCFIYEIKYVDNCKFVFSKYIFRSL